jgi:TctA family transporter
MLLILLAAPFAAIALQFGPLELASVLVFAFVLLAGLSSRSPIKGLIAIAAGVFISTIGLDPVDTSPRMTFDIVDLYDGLPLIAVAIGALALASVLEQVSDLWRDSSAAALLIGAFMIHGIVPGPFMLTMHGDVVYALFASMLIANVIHLAVGVMGIRIWAIVARAPRSIVLPPVILLCVVGVYLPTQSLFEVGIMFGFAVLGLLMRKTGYSIVGLVIGFLLGDMFETSLRQSLLLYKSDLTAIFSSPISIVFLALALFVLARSFTRL